MKKMITVALAMSLVTVGRLGAMNEGQVGKTLNVRSSDGKKAIPIEKNTHLFALLGSKNAPFWPQGSQDKTCTLNDVKEAGLLTFLVVLESAATSTLFRYTKLITNSRSVVIAEVPLYTAAEIADISEKDRREAGRAYALKQVRKFDSDTPLAGSDTHLGCSDQIQGLNEVMTVLPVPEIQEKWSCDIAALLLYSTEVQEMLVSRESQSTSKLSALIGTLNKEAQSKVYGYMKELNQADKKNDNVYETLCGLRNKLVLDKLNASLERETFARRRNTLAAISAVGIAGFGAKYLMKK